ncbi:MAG: valine--tRNA ligase [Candidatus Woesearchaeota archaeon]
MVLPSSYDSKISEPKWQKYWEEKGIYAFDKDSKKRIYSIDTPPPTVSGKMHIGHSFSYSQQDFVARYKRMAGFNVFYPYGTDDNGLATERLVEKLNNVRSVAMKRDEFIKLCLATLDKIRPDFVQDWKNLGVSCDFSIFYSTINEHCRRLSQKSFIDLYKAGREYRKRTPFMWCPECQTAIAQVEMKDKEMASQFVYMKFDTSIGEPIIIATTRPELMAACVMVHVHPDDKRYKKFVGGKAKLPLFDREVEIMANPDVDMEFGSGAVYHCTFGDMDDVEWVERYKVPVVEILNKDGTLNEKAGKYNGLSAKKAREMIIADLEKEGRLIKAEPIKHIVNVHERCDCAIEILMTDQWFVRYMDLREQFLKNGAEMQWFPEHMKVRLDNWIKGLKWDWCISRQRHFGVPFPVWYCRDCGHIIVAREADLPVDPVEDKPPVSKCEVCGCSELIAEKDVLDTWATSSLSPQLAVELFKGDKVYAKLFPMDLRPQAHDIITFWLFNTMVKSQLHYNVNPWKNVMISGFALDPHGKKMSKSKGNTVEPQVVIEKFSADCLRFWAAGSKLGEDLPFQEKDLVTGKKMITKLWNAFRFVHMHLGDFDHKKPELEVMDQWVLAELGEVIAECTDAFESYEYSKAKAEAELFFWKVFCDYYLEIVKDRLYNADKRGGAARRSAQFALYECMLSMLRLLAPILPFVTEEIYQSYFREVEGKASVHLLEWPKGLEVKSNALETGRRFVGVVAEVRKFKSDNKLSMGAALARIVLPLKDKKLEIVLDDLKAVTRAEVIEFEGDRVWVQL